MSELSRIASLDALVLPEDAVVAADRALPEGLLGALPNPILVDAGEGLKTLASVERLAAEILDRRASKPMTIVAVGGGSVGDALGFLASILWRGVRLWHLPTTLLAMVDSAHGGKTAVNLGAAKNQLGTFYEAEKVILVDEILATLPLEERQDGLFELIKGLWLGDAAGLELLEAQGGVEALGYAPYAQVSSRLMTLVERAVAVKYSVVEQDPFETRGLRTVLNLGHTVAHVLELKCGLSHGQAVGWGMLAAAKISVEQGGLGSSDAARLRAHINPLLRYNQPLSALIGAGIDDEFVAILQRDKKRVDGRLRSVLLRAPAEPRVVNTVDARDWFVALASAHARWFSQPIRVEAAFDPTHKPLAPAIEASKSELNRAQIIAALHPYEVKIFADSAASDVYYLRAALARLAAAGPQDSVALDCGEGGTTLRFLLAYAATRPGSTRLYAHPGLLKRPHAPLVDALRAGGAQIEVIQDAGGHGFEVRGWKKAPEVLEIGGTISSQFASALAMLGAAGTPLELVVRSPAGAGAEMASRPYFSMTLAMLRRVGLQVEAREVARGQAYTIRPGAHFARPQRLQVEADASSAAVWEVAEFLGVPVDLSAYRRASLQPDARVGEVLAKLRDASKTRADQPIRLNLHASPDLVPVIAVAALSVAPEVQIEGVAHLRHKESNRIEDLVHLFESVGVEIRAREDGIVIPSGVQRARHASSVDTYGDHRMAMAALLLSAHGAALTIHHPWVVAKSYPNLWRDARRLGWRIADASVG